MDGLSFMGILCTSSAPSNPTCLTPSSLIRPMLRVGGSRVRKTARPIKNIAAWTQRMPCRNLMGITGIKEAGPAGWRNGSSTSAKPVSRERPSACSLTGDSIPALPMHCNGLDGSGEELLFGTRWPLGLKRGDFANKLNMSCGAQTDLYR